MFFGGSCGLLVVDGVSWWFFVILKKFLVVLGGSLMVPGDCFFFLSLH